MYHMHYYMAHIAQSPICSSVFYTVGVSRKVRGDGKGREGERDREGEGDREKGKGRET